MDLWPIWLAYKYQKINVRRSRIMKGIIYDVYVSDVVAKNREKVKNKT